MKHGKTNKPVKPGKRTPLSKKNRRRSRSQATVADLLELCADAAPETRRVPVVALDADLDTVLEHFIQSRHSRAIYVQNQEGELVGTIALGDIVRHRFHAYHESQTHALPGSLEMATAEQARDFMHADVLYARPEDQLQDLLETMLHRHIKEVPVIDAHNHVIGDLTIVDLLRFFRRPA